MRASSFDWGVPYAAHYYATQRTIDRKMRSRTHVAGSGRMGALIGEDQERNQQRHNVRHRSRPNCCRSTGTLGEGQGPKVVSITAARRTMSPAATRYCLPFKMVKQIAMYFPETGERSPAVAWEAM
jgi:hypothetical protein